MAAAGTGATLRQVTTPSLPDWTWDETVLAYELYLRDYAPGGRYADDAHLPVQALSAELRALPLHPAAVRALPRFRNPVGVARKVQNLMHAATGKGAENNSAIDRAVVAHYTDLAVVPRVAAAIRLGASEAPAQAADDEDHGSEEGGLLYRWHAARERDRRLVAKKKQQALASGQPLTCEVCGLDVSAKYGTDAGTAIECHHRRPLADGQRTTRLADLALVCPTCHRVLHAAKPWASVDDLRSRLGR